MQIILIQAEIEVAIRNYVNSKVKIAADQDIRIDLSASRGPEGFRANIDIVDVDAAPATTPKAASPKAGAESSDELVAAKAAKAEAEKKAAAEAKAKADKLAADQAAAEAAEAQREADAKAEAEAQAAAKGNDSAGDDKSPPFDPDNKPAEQTATDAEPAAGAPEQPPVRKPLFGKSSAALNA